MSPHDGDLTLGVLAALMKQGRREPLKTGLSLAEIEAKIGAAGLGPLLEQLAAEGLVARSGTRIARYVATAEGAARLPAPAAPAARAPKGAADGTAVAERLLAALVPRLDRIEQQLAALLGERAGAGASAKASTNATTNATTSASTNTNGGANGGTNGAGDVSEVDVVTALREVDLRGRHGGLVPIPELRRAVLARTGDRAHFDARLLVMERAFRIDLKVANDARIPEAAEGIRDPGRGLLFYAVLR